MLGPMHASMAEGGACGMACAEGWMRVEGGRGREGEEMSSFRNGGCHVKEVVAVGAARRLVRTQVDRPETAKLSQSR